MTTGDAVAILSGAVPASVLLDAGLAKLASPAALAEALGELLPGAPAAPGAAVRALAAVELVAALGLLAIPTRPAAAAAVAGLGGVFAAAGLAGRLRGSRAPCGCMGGGDRPLGAPNVVLGLALATAAALDLRVGAPALGAADYTAWSAALTSVASLLLCVWMHRRLARSLLTPAAAAPPGGAAE
jgi:hypothetical protein